MLELDLPYLCYLKKPSMYPMKIRWVDVQVTTKRYELGADYPILGIILVTLRNASPTVTPYL